jgi:hypothetical protein
MAGMLQMRRSRGAVSGFLLILLGLWGALIPFIGPYFHFAYTPDKAWTYNTARLWLELLPGAAVFLGGYFLMIGTTQYMRIMEQLGFFSALGVVIVFIAGTALGRIASVTSGIPAVEPVDETAPIETVPVRDTATSDLPVRKVPARAGSTETIPPGDNTAENT